VRRTTISFFSQIDIKRRAGTACANQKPSSKCEIAIVDSKGSSPLAEFQKTIDCATNVNDDTSDY